MKMSKTKILGVVLAATTVFGATITLFGCAEQNSTSTVKNESETQTLSANKTEENKIITVTDVNGRNVELKDGAKKIVCVGASALRLVSYLDAQEYLVGVEKNDKEKPTVALTYGYLNWDKYFKDLPVIGEGGSGGTTPYEEEIIKVQPDVIFAGAIDSETADKLQQKTGIPVVCVRCDSMFGDELTTSLNLIGEICDKDERTAFLLDAINGFEADLYNRTKDVPEESKPNVYVGAVSYRGGHGIEGTEAFYAPLEAINAKNLANETGSKGPFTIEKEKILAWDPDIIFIDPNNLPLILDDYNENPDYYASLTAFNEDKVYTQPSFRWYATNIEVAIADSYYAASVLYPELFSDIDIKDKATEIFVAFHGDKAKDYYDELAESGLKFEQIDITKQ